MMAFPFLKMVMSSFLPDMDIFIRSMKSYFWTVP